MHGGGAGVLRFFHALGWHCTAVDEKPKSVFAPLMRELGSTYIDWKFGNVPLRLLRDIDVVVKNPGIPMTHPFIIAAKKSGKFLTNDFDLLLTTFDPRRVIGITGTKGKTTAALLIAHILKKQFRTIALGIPGTSFLDIFHARRVPDYVVAECSSYDLELASSSPHIAVLTTLAGDHISRHGTMRAYTKAKGNLFRYQIRGDIAVLPTVLTRGHDFIFTASTVRRFSEIPPRALGNIAWSIHPNSVSAAYTVCKTFGMSDARIVDRIHTFRGAVGRREQIYTTRTGVHCINDTTATAPIAAIDTIRSAAHHFGRAHIIPIVGGHDKALRETEIKALASVLQAYTKHMVLLDGSFTVRLSVYLPNTIRVHKSMRSAVADAARHARKGDYIILTPGCASFNMFLNEFDRGDRFERAMVHY